MHGIARYCMALPEAPRPSIDHLRKESTIEALWENLTGPQAVAVVGLAFTLVFAVAVFLTLLVWEEKE